MECGSCLMHLPSDVKEKNLVLAICHPDVWARNELVAYNISRHDSSSKHGAGLVSDTRETSRLLSKDQILTDEKGSEGQVILLLISSPNSTIYIDLPTPPNLYGNH